MRHPNFSVKRVQGFECAPGKKQSFFWDGYAPGLGVRVTAAGSKSYIFEAWLHGRSVRTTIGDERTWTLGKAQAEATRLKALIDQGLDPRRVRRAQEEADHAARLKDKSEAALVADAWEAYVKHHEKRWGARHLRDHRNLASPGGIKKKRGKGLTVQGVLHPLMQRRMVEITAEVLIAWQAEEAAKRANNARQAFQMFRAFWGWCASRAEYKSVINATAIDDKDLRAEVPAIKTKRFDVLQRAHMKPWFAAVRGLSNTIASVYLQALVLTGARREEITELKWKDVDFRWNAMWIKDKVAEEGRKVPLTPYLASLIATLPRRNQWVFSSKLAKGGRITEPRSPHNRALAIAGLPHVTLQGLRRTFASLAEWVEMPTGVVHQIQGHKPNATAEKHYIDRPLELLAVWHNKYEAWILEESGVQFGEEKGAGENANTHGPARLKLVGNR